MKQRLSDAIADYQMFRRAQQITKGVMAAELSSLTKVLNVVGNVYVENIAGHHLDRVMMELSRTNKPRSLNNHFYIHGQFFKWCADTRRLPDRASASPMYGRKAPTYVVEERRRVPVTKFPALLDAAKHPVDRMLFACGLYLLARSKEIRGIRVGDVDLQGQYVRMPVAKARGRKQLGSDHMPIARELDDEIRRWFMWYQEECGPLQPDWYLVPSLTRPQYAPAVAGRPKWSAENQLVLPIRQRSVRTSDAARYALEAIGFPTKDDEGNPTGEGMHTLRRSGARARYDALVHMGHDGALRQVQMLLHHSQTSMTEHYIGITLDRMQRDNALRGEYMYPQNAPQDNVVVLGSQQHADQIAASDAAHAAWDGKVTGPVVVTDVPFAREA